MKKICLLASFLLLTSLQAHAYNVKLVDNNNEAIVSITHSQYKTSLANPLCLDFDNDDYTLAVRKETIVDTYVHGKSLSIPKSLGGFCNPKFVKTNIYIDINGKFKSLGFVHDENGASEVDLFCVDSEDGQLNCVSLVQMDPERTWSYPVNLNNAKLKVHYGTVKEMNSLMNSMRKNK